MSLRKKTSPLLNSIYSTSQNIRLGSSLTIDDYTGMQKKYYERTDFDSKYIVGNYKWHENFPYETFLLYEYGDVRFPVFENFKDKKALDFACGSGRMVKRMSNIFLKVDGCDISRKLLEDAKLLNPSSDFYLTSGQDLGDVPENYYDFIYCTISMQHIACHTIRMNILRCMKKALKNSGCIVLQMAYNKDFPFVKENSFIINHKKVIVKRRANQADYRQDAVFASKTNGAFDVGIGEKDLPDVKSDFTDIFGNTAIWFANIDNYFKDLKGESHGSYWAKDWIFIYCVKEVLIK
jgi:SAM-dependent methyltransferase